MPLTDHRLLAMYEQMVFIREFERLTERMALEGRFPGSTHLAIGQEAIAVGVCAALAPGDVIAPTYRGRPQAIAKGVDPGRVLAEMLGRAGGTSEGKGGAMHIGDMRQGVLVANAIVAAGIPIAAGVALQARIDQTSCVVVAFFGEGATNQGVFFETLNMAALWRLPIVFLCENNVYAEMTPFAETCASPSLSARVAGMGVRAVEVDGNDVEAVYDAASDAAGRCRAGEGPVFVEAHTYRLSGHMVGDPNTYRSKEEIAERTRVEPIVRLEQRICMTEEVRAEIARRVAARLEEATTFAEASPEPELHAAYEDVWA